MLLETNLLSSFLTAVKNDYGISFLGGQPPQTPGGSLDDDDDDDQLGCGDT
jgi:hypothetical protein